MSLLGIHLTLLAGPTVPVPVAPALLEALQSVEVTHTDAGRSGFQIVFQVGRGSTDLVDYPAVTSLQFQPLARVILLVTFTAPPQVLMDGIITHQQLNPGNQPGSSIFTITGEDVSVMMDREEKNAEHPAQSEMVIALKIIGSYAQYGLIPLVLPPPALDIPLPIERTPVQQATDLNYLKEIAQRFNYVFYVTPGPLPGTNTAYWGPPVRTGVPQRALSYNMGPNSNVDTLNFEHNPLEPTQVTGQVQDRSTNQNIPVQTFASSSPPLSSQPPNPLTMRQQPFRESGVSAAQALARAQARTDASTNQVVTANGELNALSYGDILHARGLVGLRGAGYSYDGLYYVKSVTHTIQKGSYKQKFTLTREGLGSLVPAVIP
jgi:hypothetical protein